LDQKSVYREFFCLCDWISSSGRNVLASRTFWAKPKSTMFFRDVFTKYSCDSARVPASVQHCKWCSSRVLIRFKHMVTSQCSLPLHLHTRHLKLLHIRGNARAFNPMRPGIHLLTLVAYTPHPVVLPKYC
jgi:hypothetical protein